MKPITFQNVLLPTFVFLGSVSITTVSVLYCAFRASESSGLRCCLWVGLLFACAVLGMTCVIYGLMSVGWVVR